MSRWLIRRAGISVITFISITIVIFAMMRMAPVDPVDLLLFNIRQTTSQTPEDIARMRADMRQALGLDQPIPVQYLAWAREVVLNGNLGNSFKSGRPALDLVLERLPPTLLLMGSALFVSLIVGVPLGLLAALKRNTRVDYIVSSGALSVTAVPAFFLSLAVIYVFSVQLGVLPASGMFTAGKPVDPLDVGRHLILPALVLGLAGVGPILRYVRASLLETLGKEYLVSARAKGLSERSVIWHHALPNAMLPLITIVGLYVGGLLSGSFVIENVFGWPGIGRLVLDSISSRDYPVVQAFAIVVAVMVLLGNFLADLAYARADPRIRLE